MLRKVLTCVALLMAASFSVAQAGEAYKVDLAVTRNGMLVGKPSVQVLANRNADLTITPQGGSKEDAIRLLVSVAPSAEQNTVGVHVMIFDRANGEWTLRSEPDLKTKLDKNVSLTVGSAGMTRVASPIEVSVKVAASIAGNATSSASVPSVLDLAAAPARCDCCTAGNLQCCNVVSCCDGVTGNCCSPQCPKVEADRNLTPNVGIRRLSPKASPNHSNDSVAINASSVARFFSTEDVS